jgi:threonine dehydrogenase-like Zn-dependent dehydrogenase
MRALRVVGEGAVELADMPVPHGDEVLVRVTMSGICNTDLELARGYMGFRGTLGHEFVGVVEYGPMTGSRVVGEINAGCGTCERCTRGDSRHCPTRTVLGILGRDGAHADYLSLPARNLVRIPDSLPDATAVFVEPLAAACGVLERCPMAPGTRVAVIGDGKLGLLCAMVLQAEGLAPLLVGKHPAKLALARGIETALVADAARRGRVFDVVVEASGGESGFQLALALLVPQGRLVLKSTFHGTTAFDAARIVVDEIDVIGSRCGRFAPALERITKIDVSPLVTDVLSLDRGEHALREAARPGVLKLLLAR